VPNGNGGTNDFNDFICETTKNIFALNMGGVMPPLGQQPQSPYCTNAVTVSSGCDAECDLSKGYFALNQRKSGGDGLGIKKDDGDFDVYRKAAPKDATNFKGNARMACFQPRKPDLVVSKGASITWPADSSADAYFLDPGAACYDSYLHCNKMANPNDKATQKSKCDLTMVPGALTTSGQIVDVGMIGTYEITYTCEVTYDGGHKTSDQKTRVVYVADMEKPVCKFDATHPETITIEASFPYQASENAPTCTDQCGFGAQQSGDYRACIPGSQTASVKAHNVDVEQTGVYKVTYHTTTGTYGHPDYKVSKDIVRTVHVVDTLQPVIGLQFSSTEKFTTFSSNDKTDSTHTAAHHPGVNNPADSWSGWTALMAQTAVANGWMVAAAAAAVSGVALLAGSKRTASSGLAELV
jgi:hypothetical protein